MTMDFLGPWETRIGAADQVFAADGSRICTVMPKHGEAYRHFDIDVAIARVIAAAPEMLEMLRNLDAWLAFRPDLTSREEHDKVKALIAKATGVQPCA